jgi:hypothetical protein
MRLWSIHPKYLDAKGLVALWREGLLAFHVLQGKTKGYRNHPQLIRFREAKDPIAMLNEYLHIVVDEAEKRNYHFDRQKLNPRVKSENIDVTLGQLQYETEHLQRKLQKRAPKLWQKIRTKKVLEVHPLFVVIPGEVEVWEKI